jgi:hypothetical protein
MAYAFLHGYIAYKLGYRCHVVATEAVMSDVFKGAGAGGGEGASAGVEMTFEDIFLNFPDRSSGAMHLSRLEERDGIYKGLAGVGHRVFVTAGHKNIVWHQQNRAYLDRLRSDQNREVQVVYKPSGGIYNLLEQSHLLNPYWRRREQEWAAARPARDEIHDAVGHSAPGRLLMIAERLISRADRILLGAETVQDCVHGATLSLDAQELLSYRTPTTSLEAIALRHQLEVKTECMFYGVGYKKEVGSRIKEIQREVEAVGQWFHPSLRHVSTLNAQMSIMTEVVRIFREYGQFDEEQQCLIHLRKLHRRVTMRNRPWLVVINPARWYVETLVGSFSLFFLMLFLWPILFGLLGYVFALSFGKENELATLGDHMTHSFVIFFGISPMLFPRAYTQPLAVMLMVMGFAHLGIFVAHLYTLLSRR